tara:strand:- start:462 stop:572 length:111 start_codon:yes stop_codon:yes gene_type:complete
VYNTPTKTTDLENRKYEKKKYAGGSVCDLNALNALI